MNEEPTIDTKLDVATIAQFTFKGETCRAVAVAIAKAFVEAPDGSVWADSVALPELAADDKNTIGLAWRNLTRWKMIQRQEGATDHRRSKAKGRKGGVVFRYKLLNYGLLQTFLVRNRAALAPKQAEFGI